MVRWTMALAGVALVGVALACGETDYTKGEYDKKYADPDSLRGDYPPDPYNPALDGGDAGTSVAALCDGGGPIDGGACTVSFKNDLMPKLIKECGACHTATGTAPRMDNANAAATYENFLLQGRTKPINGKPYINPCSTDKATSTIACNIAATNPCGLAMPQLTPGVLSKEPTLAAQLDTWLGCGSPNN